MFGFPMKKFLKTFLVAALGVSSLLCVGCTVSRQLAAAEVLKKTKLEFESVGLDSVAIYSDLFPKSKGFLPDPQVIIFVDNLTKGIIEKEVGKLYLTATARATNKHENSISLRSLEAKLKLDSLVTLPITLKDSIQLVPGENKISFNTIMPIDSSLFHLMEVDSLHFAGKLEVSLQGDDATVPLEFNVHKHISPEEKKNLQEQASRRVIDAIVDRWIGPRKKIF